MRVLLISSVLLLSSCGLITESQRAMSATADAVEEMTEAVESIKSGTFDWTGLMTGALGGAAFGGGGSLLARRKKS